ncbi:Fic family protein [Litoribacter populi]|uniref:Fic family protein n=1 Tax=Litoribacter populi TaxID=2598460 RepID=UPI00117CCAE5|nr:Fic family protein [Litoribacter populi]
MAYNWQLKGWPSFQWNVEVLQPLILEFGLEWGEMKGLHQGLSKELEEETLIDVMVSEAIKTSAIEGEFYSREDVMSSIKNKLELDPKVFKIRDRNAAGISELMVKVRKSYMDPLSTEMLKDWHAALMSNARNMEVGDWRKGQEPMQVVSGPIGRETVHFEAPPSQQVPMEMESFIAWYNNQEIPLNNEIGLALFQSSIAHLYFESIHPFEDGNGRIGRAIAEKALAQGLKAPVLLSLSRTITNDKNAYYEAIKEAQKTLDITHWLQYFIQVIIDAQRDAKLLVAFTLKKARFFDLNQDKLEERQIKALQKMFEAGPEGFTGGMSAKKYMSITQVSKATATRDLQHLYQQGMLKQEGAGRSVRYNLNLDF